MHDGWLVIAGGRRAGAVETQAGRTVGRLKLRLTGQTGKLAAAIWAGWSEGRKEKKSAG
jgi:hypothetical protein